ncbi:MAG TPA: hypothetical protein VFB34_05095 [Chloroflexota bacterium]|nr:hypothetical protein [Chloroflexota bacterium]
MPGEKVARQDMGTTVSEWLSGVPGGEAFMSKVGAAEGGDLDAQTEVGAMLREHPELWAAFEGVEAQLVEAWANSVNSASWATRATVTLGWSRCARSW